MTTKPLANSGGTSHGHTCPQCLRNVANVAQSAFFGGYVPMPSSGAGSRTKPPLSNWLFYGQECEEEDDYEGRVVTCNGDWGKHYHHHGASFLWLEINNETSPKVGQMRMEL